VEEYDVEKECDTSFLIEVEDRVYLRGGCEGQNGVTVSCKNTSEECSSVSSNPVSHPLLSLSAKTTT
jgi:hypothetical protein